MNIENENLDESGKENKTVDAATNPENKNDDVVVKPGEDVDGASAEEGKDKKEEDKKSLEEVDYASIDMPDGFEVDNEVLEDVSPLLKDMGVSKENAEKLYGVAAKMMQKSQEKMQEAWSKQVDAWEKETLADEEIGSIEALATANRALKTFGSEKLQSELISLGIGNHPELIRFCHKIGKAISDDGLVTSSNGAGKQDQGFGRSLYGNKYDK